MLRFIRKRKPLQFLIFGGLSALFILWGVSGTLARGRAAIAGRIFGRNVSLRAFQEQELRVVRHIRQRTPEAELSPELIEGHTWLRLLLLEEVRRQRLTIPDTEVVETIQQMPFFQREGQFDFDRYQQYLAFQHLSPRQFEEETREWLLITRLRTQVLTDVAADAVEAQWQAYLTDLLQQADIQSSVSE